MAYHSKYWSCSKFANLIRGTPKLSFGTSEEWEKWEETASKSHPIRFWIAESGLDILQDIVFWIPGQITNARIYFKNRFVGRTHALTAHPRDIAPGTWCDVGDRFLPCLFNELVNFVEVEQAWMMVAFEKEEVRNKYNVPYFRRYPLLSWFSNWRSAQAGLDYLDWVIKEASDEDDSSESYLADKAFALVASEIKELYFWWTETRPNRIPPDELSGWRELMDNSLTRADKRKLFNTVEYSNARRAMDEIGKAYDAEDEAMMIRLIKIRNSLWT